MTTRARLGMIALLASACAAPARGPQVERATAAATAPATTPDGPLDAILRSRPEIAARVDQAAALRLQVLLTTIEEVQGTLLKVAALAQDASLHDPLRTVLLELFRGAKENRQLGQLISYELRQSDPASVAVRKQIISFFVGAFQVGWAKDFELGIVPRPPNEVTIRAIVGGAEALALWIIEDDPAVTPDEAVDRLISLLRAYCPWRGIGAV